VSWKKDRALKIYKKWLFEVVICNVTIISLNMISKLYSVYDFHNK